MFARLPESADRTPQVHPPSETDRHGGAAEVEADRVADDVMATPAVGVAQRIRPAQGAVGDDLSEGMGRVVSAPGTPLPAPLREAMESRFGHDFSRVRVHADAHAADSARTVRAAAYTVGHDIAFGAGRFAPSTHAGERLIAHELVHVVQQSKSGARFQAKPDTDAAKPTLRPPTAATFANFAHGGSELTAEHEPLVQSIADLYFRIATTSPGVALLLTGHTDLTGEEGRNVALGRQRAAAVAVSLTRAGVPGSFIRIESAGESEPVVPTPEREPRNRRVEARFEQVPSKFQTPNTWSFSPIDPSKLPPRPAAILPPGPDPGTRPGPAAGGGGPAAPGPAPPSRDDRAPENAPRPGSPGDIAGAFVKDPAIARRMRGSDPNVIGTA